MKILKFKLSGKTAFFKKPDVNTYMYFTYGTIHKVALLGIFGAILGYKGYNQMKTHKLSKKFDKDNIIFPEFYSKLQNIKISIVPNNKKGFIPKKVQVFNNSVGYYNKDKDDKPCNLVVNEQWLENPSWDIYVLVDNEESEKISEYILNHKCLYTPYLGKNDHHADIKDAELLEEKYIKEATEVDKIDSLCHKKFFEVDMSAAEVDDFSDDEIVENFKYEEQLPVGLDENTNMYILETLMYTNMKLINKNNTVVYKVNNKNIAFF